MNLLISPTANFSVRFAPVICALMLGVYLISCKNNSAPNNAAPEVIELPTDRTQIGMAQGYILLDGNGTDTAWLNTDWKPIDQVWLGKAMDTSDFKGRYKVCYDNSSLYILAEITDDQLIDINPDGLTKYWDDDCLEVFIDENGSGGIHQYNYNAFAYHLSLDGKAVDIAPDSSFQYYNDHVTYKRTTNGNTSTWECAFKVYKDDYTDTQNSLPLFLKTGKQMGFMLAYCDNDKSKERENFIGTVPMTGEDKNRGWIDASVFEKVVLGY
jgi:Carbohydrate family 9 binding domain-like